MKILVAPDSFKGSISAQSAAAAIAEGWQAIRPADNVRLFPQADGGEGTLDVVEASIPDSTRRSVGAVHGPDGTPTSGEWLALPDGTAVIELAQMNGLPLLKELDPLGSSTRGLGEVIAAAVRAGASSLVVALGGSASTDGGVGALSALGMLFLGPGGQRLTEGGAALIDLSSVDSSRLLYPPVGGVTILSDVTAPLLGVNGAATIFGPQKGADPAQVELLERGLHNLVAHLGGRPEVTGSGAAGGTAYGLSTMWKVSTESGADYVRRITGLDDAIRDADLVITGEGQFDSQSLAGKVVGQIIVKAAIASTPVAVIAGKLVGIPAVWATSLSERSGSARLSIADPVKWLTDAGKIAARELGTN